MKVLNMSEDDREDGSVEVELEISKEEHQLLLEYAVTSLLEKYIEDEKGR